MDHDLDEFTRLCDHIILENENGIILTFHPKTERAILIGHVLLIEIYGECY